MNIKTAKTMINDSIRGKKIERGIDVMDTFSITPELTDTFNMNSPQIAAVINSIPGATFALAAGAVSVGALYIAVLNKHYLTKNIKGLKQLKSFLSNPEVRKEIMNISEEEFEEQIEKVKQL